MIEEIYIRDIGVIAEARLELRPGLTVLTGETGAGKTMVLSALGLLLGERADTGSIRGGQPQATVEGRWLVTADGALAERLAEAGIELETLASGNSTKQAELIMNRSLSAEGRSRAAVAGRAVPVALLSEVADYLVAVHGQADQQRLRSATAQREALDQFGGAELLAQQGSSSCAPNSTTACARPKNFVPPWPSSKKPLLRRAKTSNLPS